MCILYNMSRLIRAPVRECEGDLSEYSFDCNCDILSVVFCTYTHAFLYMKVYTNPWGSGGLAICVEHINAIYCCINVNHRLYVYVAVISVYKSPSTWPHVERWFWLICMEAIFTILSSTANSWSGYRRSQY